MTTAGRAGIDAKFTRARRLCLEVEQSLGDYLNRQPFESRPIRAEDGSWKWVAVVREQVPVGISLLVGDAVHNARVALDHLAWQLVLTGGGTPGEHTNFPITRTSTGYGDALRKGLKGASMEHRARIKALQPWAGGDEDLWLLHKLDITDKHRLLVPTTPWYVGARLTFSSSNIESGESVRSAIDLNAADHYIVEDGTTLMSGNPSIGADLQTGPSVMHAAEQTPLLSVALLIEGVDRVYQGRRLVPFLGDLVDHAAELVEPFLSDLKT